MTNIDEDGNGECEAAANKSRGSEEDDDEEEDVPEDVPYTEEEEAARTKFCSVLKNSKAKQVST
jgi:hypothetical protein